MLALLVKYFKAGDSVKADDLETKILIATCVLLLEIANSDDEFSPVERKIIKGVLEEELEIPREDIEQLLDLAVRDRQESVDIWEYTNLINQYFSKSEKILLVERMWRVIYADGKVDQFEDYLAHKLADLLRLSHEDFIEAKLRAKPVGHGGR